ncbi:MAG TPA: hypothetical protein VJS15_02985 [Allosphingosinicella sp.]|nr:hypothetical protein [Allosphingosinicella sp.]
MGGFMAISMLSSLLMLLVLGAVLFVVFRKLAGAGGGGGASVAAMADPLPGTLLVTAAAMPSRTALYHMTRITGIVSGEGIEPTAVQYSGLIRTSSWPSPGSSLPVIVDRANPRNFAIQWDQVAAQGDSALGKAEALAAAMRERKDRP